MISMHCVDIRLFFVVFLSFALIASPGLSSSFASNAPQVPEAPTIGQTQVQDQQPAAPSNSQDASVRIARPTAEAEIDMIFAAVQNRFDQARNSASAPSNDGATPSTANENIPQQSTTALIGRMLMSLALVILLGLGLAWAAKRFLLKRNLLSSEYIEVLGSFAVSQKSVLHLVRVGEQNLLIGEGAGSLSLITVVETNERKAYTPETEQDDLNNRTATPINSDIDGETIASFKDRLTEWQQSLDGQHLSQEVKTSLLLLSGLSERLRRKKEQGHG